MIGALKGRHKFTDGIEMRNLCRPLRGLGILRGPDPGVTLAALRSPRATICRRFAASLTQPSMLRGVELALLHRCNPATRWTGAAGT